MKQLPVGLAEPRHPIGVVAERTGLSQDVLRVWERRHGAVAPGRTPGGQRVYSDADIERLRLLHAATSAGRSIGQLAALPTEEVAALVRDDRAAREQRAASAPERAAEHPDAARTIAAALEHARALHGARLNEALRRAAATLGFPAFLEEVAAPLLRRVGDEWHEGRLTPAQEHLVTSVLHDIIVETMRDFVPAPGAPAMLVTTPAGDHHVLGAALVGAVGAVEGWLVLYLGADLPAGEIAEAARAAGVRLVALSVVYLADRARVLDELRALRTLLPTDVVMIAGGSGAAALAGPLTSSGIHVERSVEGLVRELRAVRG